MPWCQGHRPHRERLSCAIWRRLFVLWWIILFYLQAFCSFPFYICCRTSRIVCCSSLCRVDLADVGGRIAFRSWFVVWDRWVKWFVRNYEHLYEIRVLVIKFRWTCLGCWVGVSYLFNYYYTFYSNLFIKYFWIWILLVN